MAINLKFQEINNCNEFEIIEIKSNVLWSTKAKIYMRMRKCM